MRTISPAGFPPTENGALLDLLEQDHHAGVHGRLHREDPRNGTDRLDGPAARRRFIERYLSLAHRDAAGQGRGIAAPASDVARTEPDSPLRRAYLDGIHTMLGTLAEFGEYPDEGEQEAIVELSVMAGALMSARASAGDALSERILEAARSFLVGD